MKHKPDTPRGNFRKNGLTGNKEEKGREEKAGIIVIDEFAGGDSATVHEYQMWKKSVLPTQVLHDLVDEEVPYVIYTQLTGKAKISIEIMEIGF